VTIGEEAPFLLLKIWWKYVSGLCSLAKLVFINKLLVALGMAVNNSLVSVVYLDDTESMVSHDVLDVLIATGKIKRFKRCDGWVDIIRGNAKLRDYRTDRAYDGPERRTPWQEEENN
jgi:hypothetical protein